RVAGLVCASADLSGLPYAIAPDQNTGGDRGGSGFLPSPRGVRGDGSPRERTSQQSPNAARGLREALEDLSGPPPAGGDAVAGHPFCASSELVAALSRPPEREMPGIRLALRPDFEVTQEPAPGRAAITVGAV